MKFSITPNFSKAELEKAILEQMGKLEIAILTMLQRVGENFITNARNMGSYKDRTGNLRSSIGYVILKNGLQYSEGGFVEIKAGGKGAALGKRAISRAIKENVFHGTQGYILIVVAGEDYAAAVEAKGFDVLTGSSQIAKAELRKSIDRIRKKMIV